MPGQRLSEVANLALAQALALVAPDRLSDIGREKPLPPQARDLAARIALRAGAGLTAAPGLWPARIRVETPGGPREIRLDAMPGDAGAEGRGAMLRAKRNRIGATEALAARDAAPAGSPDHTLERLRAAAREAALPVA